jgi:histidinol-phosphate/aromatic aminotransferase/cobyric acid decarboxylase-like protein
MRVDDADGLVSWCESRGIKIRNFNSQEQLEGCVRLSIGSETEMAELKLALQSFGEQA